MLWPESFLPGPDEDSLASLTEHALLTTLRNWTIFADAGFNLHLAINIPASALGKLPIARLVEENRPQSEDWPGLILEVTEDQIVRDIALAQKIAAELKACGSHHRDRQFRRRLFLFLQPARRAVCRTQDRRLVREELRDRRHQCGDLPDRDRPRAPLRQRRGGGRHREHGRSAGAGRDGLRLRAGHAGGAADAEASASSICLRQRLNKPRRSAERRRPRKAVPPSAWPERYFVGSAKASFSLSGGSMRKTLSVIATSA